MENKDKYELIVKIKELLLKSTQFDLKNMENAYEISLEASKVLQLIYSNDELKDNFENKLKESYELIKYKKEINKFYDYFAESIEQIAPNILIDLSEDENNFPFFHLNFALEEAHTIRELNKLIEKEPFYNKYLENAYHNSMGVLDNLERTITDFIEYPKCLNFNDKIYKSLCELYDYYLLYYFEYFFFEYYTKFPSGINLLLAYRKVLTDCLYIAYNIDLSEEEKQENEIKAKKNKLINDAKLKLTDKQFIIFKAIYDLITANETKECKISDVISKISKMNKITLNNNTINSHIQGSEVQKGITERITGTKGGFTDLKDYIKKVIYSN